MSIKRTLVIIGLVLCFTSTSLAASGKHWSRSSACEKTAGTMYLACHSDVKDDYLTTSANCMNISDWGERLECYEEAMGVRGEERRYCRDVKEARKDACELLGENRYDPDPLLDPAIEFVQPDDVGDVYDVNPYVSVEAGHTFVLNGVVDGEVEEIVVVHVTEETREILGVDCRVVVDIVVEESEEDPGVFEYEAIEVTDDWFAQDTAGDVYYCGEVARNYEDGVLRDLDGSFEAGIEFAKAGVIARAFPVVGETHRQEYSLGEAEDIIQYLDTATAPSAEEGGDNLAFPCSPDLCLQTFDFAPVEPESTEYKYYIPGIGFVLAVGMEDGELTGEREELTCIGDSLDVLSDDPACGIGDPDALLEELCKLSPDAFCED